MKKFLAILLSILLLMPAAFKYANAQSKGDESPKLNNQQVVNRLVQLGFSQDQIDHMSEGIKIHIASDPSIKKLLKFGSTPIAEPKSEEDEQINSTLVEDSISEDDLEFNIISVELADINGLPAVRVYEDFQWLMYPTWTLTDHLVITWTPGWYANSYNMVYNYIDGITGNSSSKNGTAYEILRSSGIAWKYDLKGNMFNNTPWPSGYAYVNLVKNDPSLPADSYSSSQGVYVHDYDFATVSVSIQPSDTGGILPGISFGLDRGHETAVRSTSWYNARIFD